MSCFLSITSATLNDSTGTLFVQGFFQQYLHCGAPFSIDVTVTCGSNTFTGNGVVPPPGQTFWQASIPIKGCPCNTPITIDAIVLCPNGNCQATTFSTPSLCCCPTLNVDVNQGLCNSNNQRLVTLVTKGFIAPACPPFTVR